MQNSLIYNNGRPQRKKLYEINDRHNLSSSVQLLWLSSLNQPQVVPNRMLDEKKSQGIEKLREKYNKYMEKKLENREDRIEKFATIVYDNIGKQDQINVSYKPHTNRKQGSFNEKNSRESLDRSLNQELENFKEKYPKANSQSGTRQNIELSGRERNYSFDYHVYDKKLRSLSPQRMRQRILRSSLDPPQYFQQNNCKEISLFKNSIPDALQNYLRPMPKIWGK